MVYLEESPEIRTEFWLTEVAVLYRKLDSPRPKLVVSGKDCGSLASG